MCFGRKSFYFSQSLPQKVRGKAVAVFLAGSAFPSVLSGPITGSVLSTRGLGLQGGPLMLGHMGCVIASIPFFESSREYSPYMPSEPRNCAWQLRGSTQ